MPLLQTLATASARGWRGNGAIGDFELISTTILGSNAASVTFNITTLQQTTYKHLQLRITTRGTDPSTQRNLLMQMNGDTASNYARHGLIGYNDGSGFGARAENGTSQTSMVIATSPAANSTANVYNAVVLDILDAFSSSKAKTVRSLSGYMDSTGSFSAGISFGSGLYMSNTALNALSIFMVSQNIAANSRFSLYGVRG
jgi:hypothetical protein